MHLPLALLLASVVILAPSATKGDSERDAIQSIINIAQITLVHIGKLRATLPPPPHINASSPSVDGITSISRDLGLLGDELLLLPFSDLLGQIRADVSSLEGRVRSLAPTMDCSVPARHRAEGADHVFPDSRLHLTLTRVQLYLEKIPPNKDKLSVC